MSLAGPRATGEKAEVTRASGVTASITSWNDAQGVVTVATDAATGNMLLMVGGPRGLTASGKSGSMNFTIQ